MKVTELTPDEMKDALQRTALNIVFANFKENPVVQAAHGILESFVILRHVNGSFDGCRLTDSEKDERKAHYGRMVKRWQDAGEGQCFTPDGRETRL